jgi:hypothetical protein
MKMVVNPFRLPNQPFLLKAQAFRDSPAADIVNATQDLHPIQLELGEGVVN